MINQRLHNLLLALIFFTSLFLSEVVFAQAGTCQKIGEVCSQGPQTRLINGHSVYRECWQYEDTYSCVDPASVNFCSGLLSNPACSQSNSVCVLRAFNNACLRFENSFTCTADPGLTQDPPNLIKLADTATLIKDVFNEAQCQPLATNGSCTKTGRVCTQGPETRIVEGQSVTRDCWEYTDSYSCSGANYVNYCQALTATPQCQVVSDTCGATGPTGVCLSRLKTYDCGVTVTDPNIVLLNTSYTIATDTLALGLCADPAASPNCSLAQEVCTEGPETRMIGALAVYKDCWKFDRTYTCASATLQSDCQELIDKGCTETSNTCRDTLPGGQCGGRERVYQCTFAAGSTQTVTNCGGQQFCMGGNCFDTSYVPDADFLKVTAAMEAGRQGGNYVDQVNFKLFGGTPDQCSKTMGSLANCCKVNANGGTNNATAAERAGALLKVGGELYSVGSTYVYDTLTANAGNILGTLGKGVSAFQSSAGNGINGLTLDMSPSFSFYGASFSFSASGGLQFVAFDPVSFAIQVAIQILVEVLSCDESEKLLAMKRGQNLCTYVGEYCSTRTLGACITKKQGYCCYNSRLARIISEQGRAQLNKSYGPPSAPTCDGFDDAEMTALDFGRMDLSEFFNEIQARLPNETFRLDKNTELLQQRVQNFMDNGRQNVPPPQYSGPPPPRN
jgi:conjugal transfer mating pair stabilization protein TraN